MIVNGNPGAFRVLLAFLVASLLLGAFARAQQKSREDNPKTTSVYPHLEAKMYWFYDGMGRLRNVRTNGDSVTGEFIDRHKPFSFRISRTELQDRQARTLGYKLAVERIISYLKPGKFSDTDDTRRELADLEKNLRRITGMKFSGYESWKDWYEENGSKLQWSEKDQHLVTGS